MRIEVKGDLLELDLPDLICSVVDTSETGVLHVTRESVERCLFFRRGRLVFASSTDLNDSLGVFLLRRGAFPLESYEAMRGLVAPGKRFGALLLERSLVTADVLVQVVSEHLLEIALDLFSWRDGRYRFVLGEQPVGETILVEIDPENLLLRGMRRITQWERIRRGIGGLGSLYKTEPWFLTPPQGLGLEEPERRVGDLLREGLTVEALARKGGGDVIGVCRSLWSLKLIKAVTFAEARTVPEAGAGLEAVDEPVELAEMELDESGEAAAGPPETDDLPAALRDWSARQKTLYGVLRAEVGAGADLFVSQCVGLLPEEDAVVFDGLEADPDGGFPAEELLLRLRRAGAGRGRAALRSLLASEVEALGEMVDPAKSDKLRGLLEEGA